MKAELKENGILKVTAETPLEEYALKRWVDESDCTVSGDDGTQFTNLLICWATK